VIKRGASPIPDLLSWLCHDFGKAEIMIRFAKRIMSRFAAHASGFNSQKQSFARLMIRFTKRIMLLALPKS
jgi:hypothetical protein